MSEGNRVSKSRFKPRALEYFRRVEATGHAIVITDRGRPVLEIAPYADDPDEALARLRGTVQRYDRPTEPVAPSGDTVVVEIGHHAEAARESPQDPSDTATDDPGDSA